MIWSSENFLAGNRLLDFLNTVDNQDKVRDLNKLKDWQAVIGWSKFSGLITDAEVTSLQLSDFSPDELSSLLDFREESHQVLSDHAAGKMMAPGQFDALFRETLARASFVGGQGGYDWQIPLPQVGGAGIRYRLVIDLMQLLQSPDLKKLRECGRCSWLFLNNGRGAGRRWCSMATCGNRAKSETFRSTHM